MVEPDRPQMTVWRMRIACLMTKPVDILCNTYCFSTATVVTRTRRIAFFMRTNSAGLFFAPNLDKMATYGGRTESEDVCFFGRVLSKTAFFSIRENSDLICS